MNDNEKFFAVAGGYIGSMVLQNINSILSSLAFTATLVLAGIRIYKEFKTKDKP